MTKTTKKPAKLGKVAKKATVKAEKWAALSKYDPKFCRMLIDHMEKGLSLRAFCGKIGIHHQTVYNWIEKYPEFKEARDIGFDKSRFFWEKLGIDLATGDVKGNVTAWMINMFNRFSDDWKRNDSNSGENNNNVKVELSYKSYKKEDK